MRVVSLEMKIGILEIKDILHLGVNNHLWQRAGLAVNLNASLLDMVQVQMGIAEGMHKVARFEAADLRHRRCNSSA